MKRVHPLAALALCSLPTVCAASEAPVAYQVQNDSIPRSLTGAPGDAARGRQIVAGRDGNCLLCHSIPETGERHMGNVAPPLSRVGARFGAGQLRLRIADPTRVNPEAAMPSYYRVQGLDSVAAPFRGKTILTAQQLEDVVAYLMTLK